MQLLDPSGSGNVAVQDEIPHVEPAEEQKSTGGAGAQHQVPHQVRQRAARPSTREETTIATATITTAATSIEDVRAPAQSAANTANRTVERVEVSQPAHRRPGQPRRGRKRQAIVHCPSEDLDSERHEGDESRGKQAKPARTRRYAQVGK